MSLWSSHFRRGRRERDLDRELRFHFDEQVRDNLAAGMPPDEARRQAALEFGGLDQVKEECREQRRLATLEIAWRDLRYAARQLRKAPGFAATGILTIAIGIGACTALFSIINGVLLRPLRFTAPDHIVVVEETRPPGRSRVAPAPAAYLDWVAQTSSFTHLAAFSNRGFSLRRGDRVANVPAAAISAGFLPVLDLEPVLGRNFRPEEEMSGDDRVALISHAAWQDHLGGRDDVLGETVVLNDKPYTIIGVLPDRDLLTRGHVFVPLVFRESDRTDYGSHGGFTVIGRLKPGVTLAQAQTDLDVVSENIGRAHPDSNLGHGAHAERLLDTLTGDVRVQLLVLMAAVGFVLLIACVNVTSLLLARANARQREIAVRAALGASRGRIMFQFLIESLLVCTLGGMLGLALAYGSMGAVAHFIRAYVPRTEEIALDGTVLAVSGVLVLLAGIGVGLIPAFQFTRGNFGEPLKEAGRGASFSRKRRRLHATLVAVEIALAMILLAGTGLLARSLSALQRSDQGFNPTGLYTAGVALGGKKYDSAEKQRVFCAELGGRIAALPGVANVAWTSGLPSVGVRGLLFHVAGTPEVPVKDAPATQAYVISTDYFRTLGIPLVQGRIFTAADHADSPRVVIINQEMARRHFPHVDPLGQRLMIMTMADRPDAIREIVGVVGDVRPYGPQSDIGPQVYEPMAQQELPRVQLVVKIDAPESAVLGAVGEVMKTFDAGLSIGSLGRYDRTLAGRWFRQRFSMALFTIFSAIALILATIGIYGVTSYGVSQRTQEIGIRMALGARAGDVRRLVLRGGARIVIAGLVFGIAGSLAFAQLLRALLFNISTADPLNLLVVSILLTGVTLLACVLPARRATKVEAIVALRHE